MTTKQPGYYRDLLESQQKSTITGGIGIRFKRKDGDVADVYISYSARLVSSGYKGDSINPPHGPEWDITITNIELDKGMNGNLNQGEELTSDEIEKIKKWADMNEDKFIEDASTQHNSY